MPVGDLGLAQSPTQVGVLAIDDRREVDQARVDVAQLDVPILQAFDELLDARKGPGPRISLLRPAVTEGSVRDRGLDAGRLFVLLP